MRPPLPTPARPDGRPGTQPGKMPLHRPHCPGDEVDCGARAHERTRRCRRLRAAAERFAVCDPGDGGEASDRRQAASASRTAAARGHHARSPNRRLAWKTATRGQDERRASQLPRVATRVARRLSSAPAPSYGASSRSQDRRLQGYELDKVHDYLRLYRAETATSQP